MYRINNSLFIIGFAFFIIACNQSAKGRNGIIYKNAVQYNDYIIGRQSTLIKNVLDFIQVSQTDLDSANKMLDKNINDIKDMLNDIKGMPAYKGDSSLRDAAINLFEFYKNVFGSEYKRILDIRINGEDATTEGVTEMNNIVNKITKEEEGYDKAFHNAQQDFAEKNHIKLGENEMQKKIDKMK